MNKKKGDDSRFLDKKHVLDKQKLKKKELLGSKHISEKMLNDEDENSEDKTIEKKIFKKIKSFFKKNKKKKKFKSLYTYKSKYRLVMLDFTKNDISDDIRDEYKKIRKIKDRKKFNLLLKDFIEKVGKTIATQLLMESEHVANVFYKDGKPVCKKGKKIW
jgi:hypothetical protein